MYEITPIGITDFRNKHQPFGIKQKDRFGHIYVIGKTGTGKTTLLLNMAIDDIQKGRGIAVIDPHGDLATTVLDYIPENRVEDVIYLNPSDTEFPIAFNPLHAVLEKDRHLVASELVGTFKKLWADSWGPRLEYILRYSILTLLEIKGKTLLDIQPLLTNYLYRQQLLDAITNKSILSFWHNEFDKYSPALKSEAIAPILNKIGLFQSSDILKNIVGQQESSFQAIDVINNSKILICNLAKGELGEDVSTLLGSILVSAIQFAALRRTSQAEEDRIPFFLYIDEMHSFVSLSLSDILAEARKFRLSLFLAHQYLDQLHEKIKSAILGNVGTMIVFRVGAGDAKEFAKEFHPYINESELINLPKYAGYIKLLIDGQTSKSFSMKTTVIEKLKQFNKTKCVINSRKLFNGIKTGVAEKGQGDFVRETGTESHSATLFS